jgi:hypothetical protein
LGDEKGRVGIKERKPVIIRPRGLSVISHDKAGWLFIPIRIENSIVSCGLSGPQFVAASRKLRAGGATVPAQADIGIKDLDHQSGKVWRYLGKVKVG